MATNNQPIVSSPIQQPSPTVVPSQIRVVVVDDSPDFLDVVCGLLGLEDFIEVVGTAAKAVFMTA